MWHSGMRLALSICRTCAATRWDGRLQGCKIWSSFVLMRRRSFEIALPLLPPRKDSASWTLSSWGQSERWMCVADILLRYISYAWQRSDGWLSLWCAPRTCRVTSRKEASRKPASADAPAESMSFLQVCLWEISTTECNLPRRSLFFWTASNFEFGTLKRSGTPDCCRPLGLYKITMKWLCPNMRHRFVLELCKKVAF